MIVVSFDSSRSVAAPRRTGKEDQTVQHFALTLTSVAVVDLQSSRPDEKLTGWLCVMKGD